MKAAKKKEKKEEEELASVCETRQDLCPLIKNTLTSTSAAPSVNTQTGISSTDTFMRASRHTHTCTHLEYTYNTLRHEAE